MIRSKSSGKKIFEIKKNKTQKKMEKAKKNEQKIRNSKKRDPQNDGSESFAENLKETENVKRKFVYDIADFRFKTLVKKFLANSYYCKRKKWSRRSAKRYVIQWCFFVRDYLETSTVSECMRKLPENWSKGEVFPVVNLGSVGDAGTGKTVSMLGLIQEVAEMCVTGPVVKTTEKFVQSLPLFFRYMLSSTTWFTFLGLKYHVDHFRYMWNDLVRDEEINEIVKEMYEDSDDCGCEEKVRFRMKRLLGLTHSFVKSHYEEFRRKFTESRLWWTLTYDDFLENDSGGDDDDDYDRISDDCTFEWVREIREFCRRFPFEEEFRYVEKGELSDKELRGKSQYFANWYFKNYVHGQDLDKKKCDMSRSFQERLFVKRQLITGIKRVEDEKKQEAYQRFVMAMLDVQDGSFPVTGNCFSSSSSSSSAAAAGTSGDSSSSFGSVPLDLYRRLPPLAILHPYVVSEEDGRTPYIMKVLFSVKYLMWSLVFNQPHFFFGPAAYFASGSENQAASIDGYTSPLHMMQSPNVICDEENTMVFVSEFFRREVDGDMYSSESMLFRTLPLTIERHLPLTRESFVPLRFREEFPEMLANPCFEPNATRFFFTHADSRSYNERLEKSRRNDYVDVWDFIFVSSKIVPVPVPVRKERERKRFGGGRTEEAGQETDQQQQDPERLNQKLYLSVLDYASAKKNVESLWKAKQTAYVAETEPTSGTFLSFQYPCTATTKFVPVSCLGHGRTFSENDSAGACGGSFEEVRGLQRYKCAKNSSGDCDDFACVENDVDLKIDYVDGGKISFEESFERDIALKISEKRRRQDFSNDVYEKLLLRRAGIERRKEGGIGRSSTALRLDKWDQARNFRDSSLWKFRKIRKIEQAKKTKRKKKTNTKTKKNDNDDDEDDDDIRDDYDDDVDDDDDEDFVDNNDDRFEDADLPVDEKDYFCSRLHPTKMFVRGPSKYLLDCEEHKKIRKHVSQFLKFFNRKIDKSNVSVQNNHSMGCFFRSTKSMDHAGCMMYLPQYDLSTFVAEPRYTDEKGRFVCPSSLLQEGLVNRKEQQPHQEDEKSFDELEEVFKEEQEFSESCWKTLADKTHHFVFGRKRRFVKNGNVAKLSEKISVVVRGLEGSCLEILTLSVLRNVTSTKTYTLFLLGILHNFALWYVLREFKKNVNCDTGVIVHPYEKKVGAKERHDNEIGESSDGGEEKEKEKEEKEEEEEEEEKERDDEEQEEEEERVSLVLSVGDSVKVLNKIADQFVRPQRQKRQEVKQQEQQNRRRDGNDVSDVMSSAFLSYLDIFKELEQQELGKRKKTSAAAKSKQEKAKRCKKNPFSSVIVVDSWRVALTHCIALTNEISLIKDFAGRKLRILLEAMPFFNRFEDVPEYKISDLMPTFVDDVEIVGNGFHPCLKREKFLSTRRQKIPESLFCRRRKGNGLSPAERKEFEDRSVSWSSWFSAEKRFCQRGCQKKERFAMQWAVNQWFPEMISKSTSVLLVKNLVLVSTVPNFDDSVAWQDVFEVAQRKKKKKAGKKQWKRGRKRKFKENDEDEFQEEEEDEEEEEQEEEDNEETCAFGFRLRRNMANQQELSDNLWHGIYRLNNGECLENPHSQEEEKSFVVKTKQRVYCENVAWQNSWNFGQDFYDLLPKKIEEGAVVGLVNEVATNASSVLHYEQGNTRRNRCFMDVGKNWYRKEDDRRKQVASKSRSFDLEQAQSLLLVGITRPDSIDKLTCADVDFAATKFEAELKKGDGSFLQEMSRKRHRKAFAVRYQYLR